MDSRSLILLSAATAGRIRDTPRLPSAVERIDGRVNHPSYARRMGADQHHDWHRLAASALEWWRDAGVDVLVEDEVRDWLTAPAAPSAAPPAATARDTPAAPVAAAALPATLEAFLTWRVGSAVPEADWSGALIAPIAVAGADLMVLLDCPEADDRGGLLEGQAGRLFDRMLAAIGRDRRNVALASVCVRRPIAQRLPREAEARLFEIARHHVALAAPKRVLVMGNAASRALIGTDYRAARGRLHPLNHKGATEIAVVATHHPRWLLQRPGDKADAWRDLQLLIGGLGS